MKCFIDIDGVLADFVMAACETHRRPNPYTDPATAEAARGNFYFYRLWGMTDDEFWGPIIFLGAAFWSSLQPYPTGRQVVFAAELAFGPGNVYLLTTPSQDPDCDAGKRRWVATHFPDYRYRTWIGGDKHIFARKDFLLVDDFDDNVDRWQANGGVSIRYPRAWNRAWQAAESDHRPAIGVAHGVGVDIDAAAAAMRRGR